MNLSERDKEEKTFVFAYEGPKQAVFSGAVTLKQADETSAHVVKMTY